MCYGDLYNHDNDDDDSIPPLSLTNNDILPPFVPVLLMHSANHINKGNIGDAGIDQNDGSGEKAINPTEGTMRTQAKMRVRLGHAFSLTVVTFLDPSHTSPGVTYKPPTTQKSK